MGQIEKDVILKHANRKGACFRKSILPVASVKVMITH